MARRGPVRPEGGPRGGEPGRHSPERTTRPGIDRPACGRVSGIRFSYGLVGWVLAALTVGYTTWFLLPIVSPDWGLDPNHRAVIIAAEVWALLALAMVVALGGVPDGTIRACLKPLTTRGLGLALAAWLAAAVAAFAIHALVGGILPTFPGAADLAEALGLFGTASGRLRSAGPVVWTFVALRILVLMPLAVELTLRGALYGWLRGHTRAWPAILISALAYAGVLASDWRLALYGLVVGLAAGWARERLHNLTPVLVVHVIQNTVLFAVGVAALS